MGMVVRTNTMALNAYRQLGMNNSAVSKSLEKLSSGFRINRAGDDAAGLAISEKMKAQITGLETASANAQDGISLIQTAEGNLNEVHDMLNRMVELATKSANGTYTSQEREALQAEVDQLLEEIDRISQSANFNGRKLLDGSMEQGGGTTVKGSDRIISQELGAGEDPVSNAGIKTILDGGSNTVKKTKFDMDFTGLAAKLGAAGGTGTPAYTAAYTQPDHVTATVDAATATDGDVKVKVDKAAANAQAATSAVGGLTITGGAAAGTTENGITFKFVAGTDAEGTTATAATWDKDINTVTVTFATDADNTTVEAAIQGIGDKTGDDGADFSAFTVTGTIDLTTLGDAEAKTAGGAAAGDMTVTLTSGAGTYTQTVATGDWSGTVTINGDNGVKVEIDADQLTTDLAEATLGAVATAGGGGGGGTTDEISVKVGDLDLAADVTVAVNDDAKALAQKVFAAITDGDNATDGTQVTINGVDWTVTNGTDGKLSFELVEDPTTAAATKGDFQWVTTGALSGNHTAGTTVTQQGQVGTAGALANTVFKIEAGDIKDGTKITLDGTTVTLAVGKNSEYKDVSGAVDLSGMGDTVDLDYALGKISETFKGSTENFIVGVNNSSNGAAQQGITVHKKVSSKETYDTKDKLAAVFSLTTAGGGKALTLQIGDTAETFNKMSVSVANMGPEGLGLKDLSIKTESEASDAIDKIKAAINTVSSTRANMGALQNRLEHTINNLDVAVENLSAANSRIRDTDMAKEMMNYTKMNVLVQSAQAMLAQANQQPQSVLQLLQ